LFALENVTKTHKTNFKVKEKEVILHYYFMSGNKARPIDLEREINENFSNDHISNRIVTAPLQPIYRWTLNRFPSVLCLKRKRNGKKRTLWNTPERAKTVEIKKKRRVSIKE